MKHVKKLFGNGKVDSCTEGKLRKKSCSRTRPINKKINLCQILRKAIRVKMLA